VLALNQSQGGTAIGASPPLEYDFVSRVGLGVVSVDAVDAFITGTTKQALSQWFGAEAEGLAIETLRLRLDRAIAEIDAALSNAVDAIIAHPRFCAFEAGWRGVAWLTQGLGPDGMTRIRLFDCRWAELARDLERAPEFDRSVLFTRIYEDEFGTPGGVPFSMIVSLHEVRHKPGPGYPTDDITALRHLSAVAAAAFTPIVLSAAPALLGAEIHGDLDLRQSLAPLFRHLEYSRLHALQRHPDTRFLGVVAPRILIRAPYTHASVPDIGFTYTSRAGPLWAGGAFAVAHIAIRAFNDHRWPAAITGTVRDEIAGGLVTGLPEVSFATDRQGVALKPPLELNLSDALDRELTEAGLIGIRHVRGTPWAAIYSLPSLYQPTASYALDAANANERMGAVLNYILCVSRFAHYIKIIGRDLIGSSGDAEDVEARLQRWLNRFTSAGDRLSIDMQARYPLQEARIRVRDVVDRPGALECSVALKPHFQIDQAVSEFRLVTVVAEAQTQ